MGELFEKYSATLSESADNAQEKTKSIQEMLKGGVEELDSASETVVV